MRTSSNPALAEQLPQLVLAEAEPDVAHLLPVFLAIVRQHVADRAAGRPASARAPLRAAPPPGSGTWCSTSSSVAASSSPSSIGSASSSPRRTSTFAKSRSRRRAACSIVAGAIDGDHARDERRERRARPVPCRSRGRRPIQRSDRAARAARGGDDAPPKSSSRSLSQWPAADAKNSCDLVCRRPARPSAAGRPGRRRAWRRPARAAATTAAASRVRARRAQRVVAAGAVAPRRHPAASSSVFRWRLTVDCGSWSTAQSSDDRQLVPLEQEQHPAARGIGQSVRSSKIAASIRISG